MYVITNYAGDLLGEYAYASIAWSKVYDRYSPECIKECEIVVMKKEVWKAKFKKEG